MIIETQWLLMIIQINFYDNSWIIIHFHIVNHMIKHEIVSIEPRYEEMVIYRNVQQNPNFSKKELS